MRTCHSRAKGMPLWGTQAKHASHQAQFAARPATGVSTSLKAGALSLPMPLSVVPYTLICKLSPARLNRYWVTVMLPSMTPVPISPATLQSLLFKFGTDFFLSYQDCRSFGKKSYSAKVECWFAFWNNSCCLFHFKVLSKT